MPRKRHWITEVLDEAHRGRQYITAPIEKLAGARLGGFHLKQIKAESK
jgi:hypothetical protein